MKKHLLFYISIGLMALPFLCFGQVPLQTFGIDFSNSTDNTPQNWNRTSTLAVGGAIGNLQNLQEQNSGYAMEVTDNFNGAWASGLSTGNDSGPVPDAVMATFWYNQSGQGILKFTLDSSKKYTFRFYGGRDGSNDDKSSDYSIGATTVTLNNWNNISNEVSIDDVIPNANGEVYVSIKASTGYTYAILNGLIIEEYVIGNSPPVFQSLPNQTVAEDTHFEISILATDQDNDTIDLSVENFPSFAVFTDHGNGSATISGYPRSWDTGLYKDVIITAGDGIGSPAKDTLDISVQSSSGQVPLQVMGINFKDGINLHEPGWNPISDIRTTGSIPDLLNLKNEATGYSLQVTRDFNGAWNKEFATGDNSGAMPDAVIETFWYTRYTYSEFKVILDPAKKYRFRIFGGKISPADDISGDYIIGNDTITLYNRDNKYNEAIFDNVIPDANGEVYVRAVNTVGYEYAILNGIIIEEYENNANNQPPVINAIADISLTQGNNQEIILSATDPENDSLTFSALDLPVFADITNNDNGTATLALNPKSWNIGNYQNIIIKVGDGANQSVSDTINITVKNSSGQVPLQVIGINFKDGINLHEPGWNPISDIRTTGSIPDLLNLKNEATGYSLQVTRDFNGAWNKEFATGDNSGAMPDAVIETFWYTRYTYSEFKVILDPAKKYRFRIFGGKTSPADDISGDYIIGNDTITLYNRDNKYNEAIFDNVVPDVNGEVYVRAVNTEGYVYAILNGLIIEEYKIITIVSPTQLVAESWTDTSISLSWKDHATNETNYIVERSDTSMTGFAVIDTLAQDSEQYTDQGLAPDHTYYYQVKALGQGGTASAYSQELRVKTAQVVATNSELSHDPRYNGNISAIKWKNYDGGDERIYAYHYDKANRITAAQYAEGNTVSDVWTTTSRLGGFSVHNLGYDPNGNITGLNRQSFEGTVKTIDALHYAYQGNRLLSVEDDAGSKGFADGNLEGDDYEYDANGNLVKDLNRGISLITYNHLDLPQRVDFEDGAYIIYVYDAAGTKLAEERYDAEGNLVGQKDYMGAFVYENDTLQLIHHPEGRIVPGLVPGYPYDYQYHLRDHLGNNRLTLSTKPEVYTFAAGFESENAETAADEEAMFSNIENTREVSLAADANNDGGNETVRLNGGQPMGAGLALPVSTGDTLSMKVYAYYEGGDNYSAQQSINAFITAIAGGFGGINGGTEAQQATYNAFDNAINGMGMMGTSNDNVPAAYLNYILFDGDMVYYQHGHTQVSINANMGHEDLTINDIVVSKPGFVYVYLSNESASQNWVYFDDMEVELKQFGVVQADDYYPFGLTFNSYFNVIAKKNNYLYQGKELLAGTGLYDFHARRYSPALGRFLSLDPQGQFASGFTGMGNNPVMGVDPDGEFVWLIPQIGWSKEGGLNIGLSLVVGIPGLASAQVGGGYNFKSHEAYGYAGASFAFNSVYTSYSPSGGWNVGYTAGASIYSGLPISTNFATVGANYNISHNQWSGNVSAWNVDRTGWTFNPSVSVMVYPEHTTNLARGQGFRSNDKVLAGFVGRGDYQRALDYFGFEGTYDPSKTNGHPGATVINTGEVFYNDIAFSNYDKLAAVVDHEMAHRANVLSGKYGNMSKLPLGARGMEEWRAYMVNYKNQGLYRNHGIDLIDRINRYGMEGGLYGPIITPSGSSFTSFQRKWWHFIYKIPRRY